MIRQMIKMTAAAESIRITARTCSRIQSCVLSVAGPSTSSWAGADDSQGENRAGRVLGGPGPGGLLGPFAGHQSKPSRLPPPCRPSVGSVAPRRMLERIAAAALWSGYLATRDDRARRRRLSLSRPSGRSARRFAARVSGLALAVRPAGSAESSGAQGGAPLVAAAGLDPTSGLRVSCGTARLAAFLMPTCRSSGSRAWPVTAARPRRRRSTGSRSGR